MIQISTQDLQLLLLETREELSHTIGAEEKEFYTSIKPELNREIRNPHESTIDRIMAYSKGV